jgi:tight adherence protein B
VIALAAVALAVAVLLAAPRRRARAAALATAGRLTCAAPPPLTGRRWCRSAGAGRADASVVACGVVGAAVVVLVAVSVGPLLAAVVAVIGGVGWAVVRGSVAARRRAARRRDAATAARVLAGEFEVGATPAGALASAAVAVPALAAVLGPAAQRAADGGDVGEALLTDADLRPVGLAWRLSTTTGAALGPVLERVGADFADGEVQRRSVATALAGPRSSAAVLAGLPALGIVLGSFMGADPLHFLLDVPAGRLTCLAGVVLDAAGVLWMRALLRRAERS